MHCKDGYNCFLNGSFGEYGPRCLFLVCRATDSVPNQTNETNKEVAMVIEIHQRLIDQCTPHHDNCFTNFSGYLPHLNAFQANEMEWI